MSYIQRFSPNTHITRNQVLTDAFDQKPAVGPGGDIFTPATSNRLDNIQPSFKIKLDDVRVQEEALVNLTTLKGEVTGNLRIPMLTMRGEFDGTAIIFHDSAYRSAVETSMRTDLLQQIYVNDLGHCYFTKQQYLMGLTALERWLDTGVKPDSTNFPAGLGFDRTFVPPPWPF